MSHMQLVQITLTTETNDSRKNRIAGNSDSRKIVWYCISQM